jgi:hypothetical protein
MEDEDDLWFLPGPIEEEAWEMPGPKMDRAPVFDMASWQQAEAENGQLLAGAAAAFGALSERLNQMGEGAATRLALLEAAELSWANGLRLSPERIALHRLLRLPASGDEMQQLEAALWCARRLTRGPGPRDGLDEFLGRRTERRERLDDGLGGLEPGGWAEGNRPHGVEFHSLAMDWEHILTGLQNFHPLSRSAAAFFAWRLLGLSGPEDVIEAAVCAARIGTEGMRGGAVHVPVALGDALVFKSTGVAKTALPRWLNAVENACLRALLMLDQLEEWRQRAVSATQDLSGRSPPLLIEALYAHPAISAEMAAEATGISRVSARRNLTLFEKRGLIRETTGQTRYRVWAAAI